MREVFDFLRLLSNNNNREWFHANRNLYDKAEETFRNFGEQFIEGINSFDSSICTLSVKDCIYRIYRDTRFSPDKTPYKTNRGIYVCKGGKSSGFAGYYLHLDIYGCFAYAGLHMPEKEILQSVREEILDNGSLMESNIKKAIGFELYPDEYALKRNPKGFADGTPYDYLLRRKMDLGVVMQLTEDEVCSGDFLGKLIKNFSTTHDFVDQLNRAVAYARE